MAQDRRQLLVSALADLLVAHLFHQRVIP
jgi:hypothetical protein